MHPNRSSAAVAAIECLPSQERVDDFVRRLHHVAGKATLEFAVSVGRIVIETFYGNDLSIWRRHPRSHPSIRLLSGRADLPISLPQLYRCIAIFDLSERMPALSTWKHLGASHVRTVLGLPAEEQSRLLRAAEEHCWPVHRLDEEVHQIRSKRYPGRGRPRLPDGVRRVLSLERWLADCPDPIGTCDLEAIEDRIRVALHRRIIAVSGRLTHLEAALRPTTSRDDRSCPPSRPELSKK